ncbi:MAG: di-heme oxidoredictase family protein [Pseudomonadota bacterium]
MNDTKTRTNRIIYLGKAKKIAVLLGLFLSGSAVLLAQTAAAPQQNTSNARAGQPLPGLKAEELSLFDASKQTFQAVDGVQEGFGPRFNASSCAMCHAHPAIGGSSPPFNPQIASANANGARNLIPGFITLNGPIREARFKLAVDARGKVIMPSQRDGGVHALFTITGRTDAPGCILAQPPFALAAAQNNLAFRIPTPTFGAGLIEAIADDTILNSFAATRAARIAVGITGHPNRNDNDGTINRFGWKAQNKSILVFSGEAYAVEQGVTNELFPNERDTEATPMPKSCYFNGVSEDHAQIDLLAQPGTPFAEVSNDIVLLSFFMRYLAPPAPQCDSFRGSNCPADVRRGRAVFEQTGCALCHTPTLAVGKSPIAAVTNQRTAQLFSDLLVHHMGAGLADGITQGQAGDDEFRTAPLWGLGQRVFFLHDGRTNNVEEAIKLHASTGSEANQVIGRYHSLPASDKQALVKFLKSL